MSPLPVVKHFHVIEQADPRIVAGLVVAVHDQFGLERMEETLHGRIVPTISSATHALPDAMAVDDFSVASGGGSAMPCSCGSRWSRGSAGSPWAGSPLCASAWPPCYGSTAPSGLAARRAPAQRRTTRGWLGGWS